MPLFWEVSEGLKALNPTRVFSNFKQKKLGLSFYFIFNESKILEVGQ